MITVFKEGQDESERGQGGRNEGPLGKEGGGQTLRAVIGKGAQCLAAKFPLLSFQFLKIFCASRSNLPIVLELN